MSPNAEYVVVRQTVSNGAKWYIAKAGQYCTRDLAKAVIYPTREDAEHVANIERRDLERGRGRPGVRVFIEQVHIDGSGATS